MTVTSIRIAVTVDDDQEGAVIFETPKKISELLESKDSIGSFLRSLVASVERGEDPTVIRAYEEFDG